MTPGGVVEQYGRVAVEATRLLIADTTLTAAAAWDAAASRITTSQASRDKGCPRGAFLGLCEAGLLQGVCPSGGDGGGLNGQYAVRAAKALRINPGLQYDRMELWHQSCLDRRKAHNGQMDVVVGLSQSGLLSEDGA